MSPWPSKLKKTSARQEVLHVFEQSNPTLSVAQLQVLCPNIPIATLYRVIEVFLQFDVLEISDEFQPKEKHYVLKDSHGHHLVKCMVCHQSILLKECPIHLDDSIEGFKILHHRLEIEGICADCQVKQSSNKPTEIKLI